MEIKINHISHTYGNQYVLKDISLVLGKGIYGLLGPNGAGKSTLISILTTSITPTAGQILCDNRNICRERKQYLNRLGYMPQYPGFYKNFTAEDFLRYIAALKDLRDQTEKRIREMLDLVNLSAFRKKKIGTFSGGMKQRLGIAQALLNDPEFLILDEPTAGLDPIERIRFRNLISRISYDRTILLATHIVSDIESIANKIILLDKGEVIRFHSPQNLKEELSGKVWTISFPSHSKEADLYSGRMSSIVQENDCFRVRIISDAPIPKAVSVLPRLDDVFLYHFGKESL